MKYLNAREVLPQELLTQVQRYAAGHVLYVPSPDQPKSWGETSGLKARLIRRNRVIRSLFQNGSTLSELAEEYYLSVDSIRKIVYGQKEELPAFQPDLASAGAFCDAGMAEEWVRLWLKTQRGAEWPGEDWCVQGVVHIPLRLIRTPGSEGEVHENEPLLVRFENGIFLAQEQSALLGRLRREKRNAYPALVVTSRQEYARFMLHYGRHFRSFSS